MVAGLILLFSMLLCAKVYVCAPLLVMIFLKRFQSTHKWANGFTHYPKTLMTIEYTRACTRGS